MPRARVLVCFAALLLTLATVACGGGGKKSSSAPSSSGQAPSASAPANPAEATTVANDFSAFASAISKVKSFKATITTSPGGTAGETQATMEVQLPDRYHVTSPAVELINIGKDSYVKAGANWVKSPSGGGGSLDQIAQLPALATAIPMAQISKGGTDTVNGTKCQLYTQSAGGATTEYCLANNLPLRVVVTSGPSKSTILFSDYDKPVDIKAPI